MKNYFKTILIAVAPVTLFTLLASCSEYSESNNNEAITKVKKTEVKLEKEIESGKENIIQPEKTVEEVKSQVVIKKVKNEIPEPIREVEKNTLAKEEVVEAEVVLEKQEEVLIEEEEVLLVVDHSIWDALLRKNVSSTGKVNYKGFKADKLKLEKYITILKSKAPTSEWSKNEKLAYWINVYNAFTVKLIVDNYPLKSITNLDKPWDKKFIIIKGKSYSLGDVENNILRKMGESRIHFAINCASVSCPKLLNEAFTSEKLSSQLRSVTKSFFADKSKNQIVDGNVKVSKLFEWYANDFSKGNIIAYINKYSGKSVSASSKISFLEYNWNLNE